MVEIRRGDEGRELLTKLALTGTLMCAGGGPEGGGGIVIGVWF